MLTHINTPQVVVLGGFLTHDECDALIEGATEHMQRSLVSDYDTGGDAYSEVRTSYGMFYKRGETELVQRVESRIAALCDWPVENGEGLQILNYKVGAEYKPHHDYFPPDATTVKLHGQRVATLVMYLNDPIKGGGTVFPDLNLEVLPKKGNAVFFSYPEANPSSKSLHGGSPVLEGEKWAATKWMRASAFV